MFSSGAPEAGKHSLILGRQELAVPGEILATVNEGAQALQDRKALGEYLLCRRQVKS